MIDGDADKFKSELNEIRSALKEVPALMEIEEEGSYARQFAERARKSEKHLEQLGMFANFI